MAIDFGQAFRGIATGAMSAYNEAVEKKDQMYAEIAVRAGDNYLNNILPETQKAEEMRKDNYDLIASNFGNNFAELMDINKITTQKDAFKIASDYYKNADKDKLEAAMFETNFQQRYNQRGKTFNEKYAPVKKFLGEGIGTMGPYTVDTLVGEKQEQPMKEVTTKDTMTDTVITEQTPVDFSSSAISDFIIQPQISFDVPESEFQKVASTMREFGQFFTQDPSTGELKVNLNETNRNEYGALRNLTQEIAQNYLDQDGNVNVSAAMTAASNMLTNQTKTTIYGRQLADRYEQGIASADGNSFSENFNNKFKTDVEKKQYLANGLFNLDGGKDAQRFFAQSFPETVKFSDDTLVRDYLLRLTGLKR
jgi:hypothetical protein